MRRRARAVSCPTCGAGIITGLDDNGIDATCELIPLTRHGELQAALAGRKVWRLDVDRRLWATGADRISSDAPLPGDHRLTKHLCGHPVPAMWVQPIPVRTPAREVDF